ncbi:MAG TPA: FAD-dependent oxidoreductase [Magnetospirillaceae bacterium]|jgi:predicted NAD/FAD-binding protein
MLRTEARICVVGAGLAGLSAAWYLQKRGYHRITILEKAPQVGGKCFSLVHGDAVLDLGAVMLMPSYRHVLPVIAELGLTAGPMPVFHALRWAGEATVSRTTTQLIVESHGILDHLRAVLRLLLSYWRHSAVLRRPGLAGMSAGSPHADLAKPFAQWASERGVMPALTLFQSLFHSMGYGDVEHLPTAYVLRYVSAGFYRGLIRTQLDHVLKLGMGWPRRIEEGFGELARRMARGIDIRTGAQIEAIRRDDAISVSWSEPDAGAFRRREERFDRLILACPPMATAGVMDWSADEARLFGRVRVRTKTYTVTACETTGIPVTLQFFETSRGPGDLVGLWRPSAESTACLFYTYAAEGDTADTIMTRLRADVPRIHPGATLGKVIHHVDWHYFPHVDAETFADGYYDAFEALQGQSATWHCGALLSFEAVENVFAYSKALVERMVG